MFCRIPISLHCRSFHSQTRHTPVVLLLQTVFRHCLPSQGLREALRDLRKKSDGELAREIEAHHSAVSELESVLDGEREKGDKAAVAADEEIAQLRSALEHTQGKLQVLLQM